jgi:hypothetical protein
MPRDRTNGPLRSPANSSRGIKMRLRLLVVGTLILSVLAPAISKAETNQPGSMTVRHTAILHFVPEEATLADTPDVPPTIELYMIWSMTLIVPDTYPYRHTGRARTQAYIKVFGQPCSRVAGTIRAAAFLSGDYVTANPYPGPYPYYHATPSNSDSDTQQGCDVAVAEAYTETGYFTEAAWWHSNNSASATGLKWTDSSGVEHPYRQADQDLYGYCEGGTHASFPPYGQCRL